MEPETTDTTRAKPNLRSALLWVAICAAMFLGGRAIHLDAQDQRPWYVFLRSGAVQLGLLGAALGLLYLLLAFVRPSAAIGFARSLRRLAPRLLLAGVLFFGFGELLVRVWFRDGMTFGNHYGPLVRRYERDFVMNRHDGPSRGPEVLGEAKPGWVRILVQGDSITWGQGVRKESELYTTVALEQFRKVHADTEMAVLAFPGREIDSHIEQIERHGATLRPDVVVYQWYVNDCEMHPDLERPLLRPPWRRLFFHAVLSESSYLWSLLDNQGQILMSKGDGGYMDYLLAAFATDTPAWRTYAELFATWANKAKALSPRVALLLYPHLPDPDFELRVVYERMRALCAAHGVECIDLAEPLARYRAEPGDLAASRFDLHPNAKVHGEVGDVLARHILTRWPDLFGAPDR